MPISLLQFKWMPMKPLIPILASLAGALSTIIAVQMVVQLAQVPLDDFLVGIGGYLSFMLFLDRDDNVASG